MTSRTRILAGLAALTGPLALLVGCGGKPCDPIPASATAKALGFILDGGVLCKEDKSVATVDYPKADADALVDLHKGALGKGGWKVEVPSEGVLYSTRAKDTLFIVTGKKSKDRGVPFAVVRYCRDEGCRKDLSALADAMKKK
jgi:hypothetical protein